MNTINVGVIGVGAMGYNHARVYSKLENANLVAVADVVEETVKKVAKKYNTKAYCEIEDLLKDPEIEVVSVCVPTTFHHDVVMQAIEYGKHVLVEKPIAFTEEEAVEMINAAKEKGVKLATGHVERFNPAVQKAKELIDNEVIGDLVAISAKRVGPFPPRIKDVGVAIDLAIHDLDVMNFLIEGKVEQVYASMSSILDKCEFEDHAEIMVNFEENITGILEVNWLTPSCCLPLSNSISMSGCATTVSQYVMLPLFITTYPMRLPYMLSLDCNVTTMSSLTASSESATPSILATGRTKV